MSSQESTDVSPQLSGTGAIVQLTETSRLLPWLMLASMFSGMALVATVFCILFVMGSNDVMAERIRIAEREARVAVSLTNDLRVELAKQGIKINHD